ncbi:hypothetical protein IA54_012075 [Xanthomonas phaseoli pv. syngonii LMG 9055]|uniref:Uncharacterized protein n=1 Tax=Xanthomonas phaseoli pv. syngonii LMG 9055 TaxID=1437878 RepID=A0A1V9GVY0_9XANT|nr:hypothetical protein IA54_012075 [Xanthomonas phaseoli pv. syngonii LMG 9055]
MPYWIHVSTVNGSEALVGDINDEQLDMLAPLFNELGAAIEFGVMGSKEVLGGYLASLADESSEQAFILSMTQKH